jgi:hypothetical protein
MKKWVWWPRVIDSSLTPLGVEHEKCGDMVFQHPEMRNCTYSLTVI